MKNLCIIIVLLVTLTFGCATKIYRPLPTLANPNEYTEVVIIRNKAFAGSALGIGIQIDGYKVASLSVGHHLRAKVNPGQHAVGTMSGSITLSLESKQTYYFLTGLGISGDQNIERLDEAEAKKWMSKSTEVLFNQ
jgi:uncharacterized protein YceK